MTVAVVVAIACTFLLCVKQNYLQSRVETLHRILSKGGDQATKWIKERGVQEELATCDSAQLVTPPEGLEIGFVPVVLYEGTQKPETCSNTHAAA